MPIDVLVVATKLPWPPVDGGRLALAATVAALSEAGARLRLVAPVAGASVVAATPVAVDAVPVRPRSLLATALRSLVTGQPLTVARHDLAAVRAAVAAAVARRRPDVVHAEQLQALAAVAPALAAGIPVVLRQQNLEHRLWRFSAHSRGPLVAAAMRLEARRLARFEAAALSRVAATVALTAVDHRFLVALAPAGARLVTVEVPFPSTLPGSVPPLPGEPAVTLLASGRWRPNQDLVAGFLAGWWPAVRAARPGAVLHLFGETAGGAGAGIVVHPAPADSAAAFPPGSITVIPARHDTGVPMKGLEAWARGVPVVASPEAAASLAAEDGRQLLVADNPTALARAVSRLADDPALATSLVAGGRALLVERHDPARVAQRLLELYTSVASGEPSR